jgi:hypothetical protein
LPAWRTDSPVCRAKYPLQAGVFGLQAGKEADTRFQVGKIGLQRMQATSEDGQEGMNTGWRTVTAKDVTESTEGEQEVMGMGACKGASLWGAFETVFLPCYKFKETRFQRAVIEAYPHCLPRVHMSCCAHKKGPSGELPGRFSLSPLISAPPA